jgi:hypothetical protein
MTPNGDEMDRLVDSMLHETLGNETAPDLREKILSRIPERKAPSLRRLRIPRKSENPWMIAAAAAAVFIAVILAASVLNGPEKQSPASARKPVEKAPAPQEALAPRAPETPPAPLLQPEQRRDVAPKPPSPAPERTPEAPKKEEPKKPEPEPPTPTPPAPPKPDRETRATGIARVEQVEGDVQLMDGDTRTPTSAGQEISFKQGLMTSGAKSRALIKYPDGTLLELGPDTLLRDFAEGSGRGKSFFVARGSVSADVKKQPKDRPLLASSPQAEAKVLGTMLRLKVDPAEKGATRLDVTEGKVALTRLSDMKTVDVVGGHYAVAAAGLDLVSRPLPPARVGAPERPLVIRIQVLSADTGLPILQLDPLEDRMSIVLAELPTRNLNIRAVTSPENVGCVTFTLDAEHKLEVNAPYLLMGNNAVGKPLPWTPSAGDHVLTVTAYSGGPAANRKEGTGNAGPAQIVRFRIK